MMVRDPRTQHRPDVPHDCVTCGTTWATMTAAQPVPIHMRATDLQSRCGAVMPVSKGACKRPYGHTGRHRSMTIGPVRPRTSIVTCGARMRNGEICAFRLGHKSFHRSRANMDARARRERAARQR